MSGTPARIQFVVSGRFLALFVVATVLLGGGYYWYSQQQQLGKHFQDPPYFVNRGQTVVRPCNHCLSVNGLKQQGEWNIGPPSEIPGTEQRWFLAVEDPPLPVNISGVLMLPVHPALRENPAFGFDQGQVLLVLFQNLQRMPLIQQPPVIPPPTPPVQPTDPPPPVTEVDGLKIERRANTLWRIEVPADGQWHDTEIPVIAGEKLTIHPTTNKTYEGEEGRWNLRLGDYEYSIPAESGAGSREYEQVLSENLPVVSGPDWLATIRLQVQESSSPALSLDVASEFQEPTPDGQHRLDGKTWEDHLLLHQQAQQRAEELLKKQ